MADKQIRAVAYCRVSTNKNAQLDSLEAQEQFFRGYADRSGYKLVNIYADPGKSGVKIKNRTALIRLLADAKTGQFDMVLIKDVSRLARNTVDFLTSIRNLKALGINVVFVNYDQSTSESSEFMLTLLSAIAQEESANTSKRVKFGKQINAKNGRVPNLVYGYEKINGDYFCLSIVPEEAKVVADIFVAYVDKQMGAGKIAEELNAKGVRTKRGHLWSQNAVSRILTNPIYAGKVINGKEEIGDFLTGKRTKKEKVSWIITENEAMRIVTDELFDAAQRVLKERQTQFASGFRHTTASTYATLIKCKGCQKSYKKIQRQYKKTSIKWVCATRNTKGQAACDNATTVDEAELTNALIGFFKSYITTNEKTSVIKLLKMEQANQNEQSHGSVENVQKQIKQLMKKKDKNIELFQNDLLDMAMLKEKNYDLDGQIGALQQRLECQAADGFNVQMERWEGELENLEGCLEKYLINNSTLKQMIERCEVDKAGEVDVYLKVI